MGPAVLRHSFHRNDLRVDRFNTEHQTGKHRRIVHEHGASAALSQLAAMLRPREIQVFTQDLQQGFVDLRGDLFDLAVDAKAQERFG